MKAYIDDSMNDGEVLVFGGLISTAKDWEAFSVEWRQYLHEERIRVFKLKRAAPKHAERLYQVVCDHAKAALCFVVPIPSLKESAARYGLSETPAAKPYLWAYKGGLQRNVDICHRTPYIQVIEGRREMARKAPGKAHREGLTVVELMDMFPTETAATEWFEGIIWPNGRHCPKCGSERTREASHRYMPYWCADCRSYFSVKTNTPLANSKVPMRKWAIAIYLCLTSLKSVSSMKLQRDIGVSQPTAWFMMHRIREAWGDDDSEPPFDGPVEVDETYVGGKRRNMSNAKRKELAGTGRGAVGKTAVIGMKDRATNQVRAEVITETDAETLHEFVEENTEEDATVYTDEAAAYKGIEREHEAVKHSVSEYVRGQAHTNGIESFWSMFERSYHGTFHKISPKHLDRYVREFAAKHNIRQSDTLAQMRDTVARFVGRRLLHRDLIAPNGLSNAGRA